MSGDSSLHAGLLAGDTVDASQMVLRPPPLSCVNQNKQKKRMQVRASFGLQVSSVASVAIATPGCQSSISLLEVNKLPN